MESAKAADSVLSFEKKLSLQFPGDKKYSFEKRNNSLIRQYSSDYTIAYDKMLNGMVERRMRQSIFSVASFWYTAWVNAGQPDLSAIVNKSFSANDLEEFEKLNNDWKNVDGKKERDHE